MIHSYLYSYLVIVVVGDAVGFDVVHGVMMMRIVIEHNTLVVTYLLMEYL